MIAITRDVSPSLAACELSFVPRMPIDIERAIAQHTHYCRALRMLGCDIVSLAALDDMPDAVLNLMHLVYSWINVSFPVEVWSQPRVPDTGSASFDCFVEPVP